MNPKLGDAELEEWEQPDTEVTALRPGHCQSALPS